MEWTTEEAGFKSRQGKETVLFFRTCRQALGAHPATDSVTNDGHFLGSEAARRKADLHLVLRLEMPS